MTSSENNSCENSVVLTFGAATIALLFWSGTAIANKIAVVYMDGLTAGVLRSMLAGLFAIVFALFLRFPFPQTMSERLLLFASGISSFAIWPVLLSIGIERTTVGHAALIMALIPIFTVLIATLIRRRMPRAGWWVGSVLAILATAILIIGQRTSLQAFSEGSSVMGDLLVLSGGLICAIGYVAGAKLSLKIGTVATTFWGLSVALIVLIPVFISISESTVWFAVANDGWFAIAWMTLFSSLAGYALWFYALGRGGIGRVGSLQLAMPVLTLIMAVVVLSEIVTPFIMVTCLCIVLGTFLAQRYAN